jgi:hypothetical protein
MSRLKVYLALILPLLAPRAAVGQAKSSKDDFYAKRPGQLRYDGIKHYPCDFCAEDIYIYSNRIYLDLPKAWDEKTSALVATVQDQFRKAAASALQHYSNALPIGWADLSDTLCRSYIKGKSLVLPRPYFDDVAYCIRLRRTDTTTNRVEFGFPTPERPDLTMTQEEMIRIVFDMQLRANVSVTMNENSGYREAKPDELTPYQKVLVALAMKTKAETLDGLRGAGWSILADAGDRGESYVAPKGVALSKPKQ